MSDLIFLKLGGSLLTDKTGTEALRADTLQRLAAEIAAARAADPQLRLVLGHGSGSFGHVEMCIRDRYLMPLLTRLFNT